jgi:predicted RecB family nuclease
MSDSLLVSPRATGLSPSRLNDFLGCEYRPWLDLERAAGRIELVEVPRPDADLIKERGEAHERRFLERLVAEGRDVSHISGESLREKAQATEAAMRAGREVIHQAAFAHDGWSGHADFLIRIDEPSAHFAWSYEVHDAKLARHPKPNYIFQLLFYTDQVERIQGTRPRRMHLILGDDERPPFAPEEFDAYAAQVRAHFLARRAELRGGATPAYPYPVPDCDFCPWWKHCKDKRRAEDHLSLVAGLQRSHGLKLEVEDVHSVAAVAALDPQLRVPRLAPATLEGLREQADLQIRSRGFDVPLHKLRPPEPERGLARLPARSDGDVFFDFEGDPYWGDDGLEYLFGTVYRDEDGSWRYWPLWAHNRPGEKRAFEIWMDWITERLARYPDLHIFHFNHYEPTTLKKLMSRYATREHEVDELLRRHVFVDLFTVLRQGARVGTESYGLKAIEAVYRFNRDNEVEGGSGAARTYEQWIESGDDDALEEIALYNENDCRSTLELREWLTARRPEAEDEFDLVLDELEPEPPRELTDSERKLLAKLDALRATLTDDIPEDEAAWTPDQRARALTAALIDYHRREAKPGWWEYFARLEKSPVELREDDSEAIGELSEATDLERETVARSWVIPMRFPDQDYKIGAGTAVDPRNETALTVERLDEDARVVWIRRGKQNTDPLPQALIPGGPYNTTDQRAALVAFAERVRDRGLEPARDLDASVDLLAGSAPRFLPGTPPLTAGPLDLDRLREQVARLDRSSLFVQGPPGSGKTWLGGRLAVDLMRRGLRVGVAATSHKAIANLIAEVDDCAREEGFSYRGLKKASGGDDDSYVDSPNVDNDTGRSAIRDADGTYQLLAGTAWLWAWQDMKESVDVLFVDEAGQVSLADAIAMSRAARSVVLLGDPQQLAHVSQGTHPHDSGVSVLQHLLGDRATVPPDRGVFLERTWRMHPDVCSFVSNTMYDGRLWSVEGCDLQTIESPGLSGSGLRMLHVDHDGARQRSPEEAERIAAEIERLLDGGRWRDRDGDWHPLTLEDILVVAPYNAQVRCLKTKLTAGARVGTVDKFQGQQAPIVFFTMATSSGEDVPRGMSFLFSRNRLNVAVSRAQALAVVVCAPQLLWTRCGTVEDMRLVNMLCRFRVTAQSATPCLSSRRSSTEVIG